MRIARLYGLGREEVTGPEEDRKQDYVIDDPAKQRLAAEEYIAYLAQKEVKPSWWREMLQKIRMALAKLPLFRDVTMTDRQIELLLARAGRKMRSRNNRAAVDVMWGGNKALNVGDEEGVRMSYAIENADPEIKEAFPVKSGRKVDENLLSLRGQQLVNRDTGIPSQINREQRGKLTSQTAVEKSKANGFTESEHMTAVAHIESLYKNAVLLLERGDTKNKKRDVIIRRFAAPIVIRGMVADALLTQKESTDKENGGRLYSLELTEIVPEENFRGDVRLDPGSPVGNERLTHEDYLPAGIDKLQRKHEKIKSFLKNFREMSSGNTGNTGNTDGIRKSISPVWTGSAADYDAPSLHYVGTGEGAQVYGWGLYGSESEKVARWYAEVDAERKNEPDVRYDGVSYRELPQGDWRREALDSVEAAKGDINVAINSYREFAKTYKPRFKYSPTIEKVQQDCQRKIDFLEANRDKITFVPPKDDWTGTRNLYEQTFWPDKQENLLDWDKKLPARQMEQIRDAMRQNDDLSLYASALNDNASGEIIYQQLVTALGSPKAASEFLYRAGIDGVTYIGDSSGIRNYVAFSDQDINIDEHIRFSLAEYSDEDQRDIVAILRPFVGMTVERVAEDYQRYLERMGVDIPAKDALGFAVEARYRNTAEAIRRGKEKRDKWLYENLLEWKRAVDYAGSANFKIRLSPRFADKKADLGTFILKPKEKYKGKVVNLDGMRRFFAPQREEKNFRA